VLAAGASYPQIAITVNVAANAPASVVNTATVSAPGDFNSANNQSSDVTIIEPADLTITKTHVGNFTRGQPVATYTIQVANIGAGVTNGPIRVTDAVPVGLDLPGAWGSGWACRTVSAGSIECTRSSALAGRTNAPPITLAVSVRNDAANSVINTARVDGGGEVNRSNNEAADPTTIESNVAPTIGSVTPSSLISAAGVPQTFTAVYSDANGYGNLVGVGFLVNAGPFASGGIYVFYNPTLNLLGLGTDSGSGTAGSCTPGSRTTLRNSQGSVDCASARVTGAGSSLTLRVTIVPAAAFASAVAKNLYMEAMDWNYPRTGLIQVGTWTITR
jgi:hypothetical protein